MNRVRALVPARGGSKGILRKNLAPINGRPMILHVLDTLAATPEIGEIVVTSDDAEIRAVCEVHGFRTVGRPPELATDSATVDDVVGWAVASPDVFTTRGSLLLAQPTLPQLTPADISSFLFRTAYQTDTAMAAVQSIRHLVWEANERQPVRRVNRQQIETGYMREIGLRYYPPGSSEPPFGWVLMPGHLVDVDTLGDLAAVRQSLERKRVQFLFTADQRIGSGHMHRCLTLAEALQHHDVRVTPLASEQWVHDTVTARGFDTAAHSDRPHLLVVDLLDSPEEPEWLGTADRVVTFEDHGPGARFADLVINALYEQPSPIPTPGWWPAQRNAVYGSGWAILRPEFLALPEKDIRDEPARVLVTFGGTDPSLLTPRLVTMLAPGSKHWLGSEVEVRIVQPPGVQQHVTDWSMEYVTGVKWVKNPQMAAEMVAADLIITSAGRTVYEAAATGTPTIVLAQNQREQTHCHLGPEHGNVYLGLGKLVGDDEIARTVGTVLGDVVLRREMSARARASIDGKGLDRVVWRLEGLLRGL